MISINKISWQKHRSKTTYGTIYKSCIHLRCQYLIRYWTQNCQVWYTYNDLRDKSLFWSTHRPCQTAPKHLSMLLQTCSPHAYSFKIYPTHLVKIKLETFCILRYWGCAIRHVSWALAQSLPLAVNLCKVTNQLTSLWSYKAGCLNDNSSHIVPAWSKPRIGFAIVKYWPTTMFEQLAYKRIALARGNPLMQDCYQTRHKQLGRNKDIERRLIFFIGSYVCC